MESPTALLVAASVIALLALVSSAISVAVALRLKVESELRTTVRQLVTDMHELFDVVEKWTRRDRVRRLREGRENAGLDVPAVPQGPVSKEQLRAMVRARNGGGH